jgi:hypothetical protein
MERDDAGVPRRAIRETMRGVTIRTLRRRGGLSETLRPENETTC